MTRIRVGVVIALCAALAAVPDAEARSAPRRAQAAKSTAREPWLLFPVDVRAFQRVSSKFGLRKLHKRKAQHGGVDFVAPAGAWVVAAREGRVAGIGRNRLCGWYVRLVHENGWRTVYCHLRRDPRSIGLRNGAWVTTQSVLGEVGSTGRSTGPHLHFTLVAPDGRHRDPLTALFTPRETYDLLKRGQGLALGGARQ